MSHTTPAPRQVHRTLCVWQMTTVKHTTTQAACSHTSPHLVHCTQPALPVLSCRLQYQKHPLQHNFQNRNYITSVQCHNVINYLPHFQNAHKLSSDVLATRTHCNFIISFTYLLILVKNMTTSFEVLTVVHLRILVVF